MSIMYYYLDRQVQYQIVLLVLLLSWHFFWKVSVVGSRDQMCVHPEVSKETNNNSKVYMCQMRVKAKTCHYYNQVCNGDLFFYYILRDFCLSKTPILYMIIGLFSVVIKNCYLLKYVHMYTFLNILICISFISHLHRCAGIYLSSCTKYENLLLLFFLLVVALFPWNLSKQSHFSI